MLLAETGRENEKPVRCVPQTVIEISEMLSFFSVDGQIMIVVVSDPDPVCSP